MLFRTLAPALLLLCGSAAAFHVPPGDKPTRAPAAAQKTLAGVLAAGVLSVSALLPFPGPALAADSLVLGTPLEAQLANFGAASYPVFNAVSNVAPLADSFLALVDGKVQAPVAAEVAQKAVDGLLAIPDSAVNEYRGVLKQVVYSGVSRDSCVTLGGSGAAAKTLAASPAVKSVDPAKIAALTKKFQPANSAVPLKGGDICLPGSVGASEKLWVAQAELTLNMPKAEGTALVASISKVGLQVPRATLLSLKGSAEGVFSKNPEALKMVSAGKAVEPSVISTVKAALK